MTAEYVFSWESFRHYCENNYEKLNYVDGCCNQCHNQRVCYLDNKRMQIDSLFNMELSESRFPKILKFLQSKPELINLVPAKLYKMAYGFYHRNFSCPFCTSTIFNNLQNLEKTYQLLFDDESKNIFLNVLMYRLTLNIDYILRAYSLDPLYFIKQFRGLNSKEIYVDCGAYDGDSFISYCKYNVFPKVAYLFEPDSNNRKALDDTVLKFNDFTEIHIISQGVYSFSGKLYFVEGKGQCSYMSKEPHKNSVQIDVTSIDDAINEDISFIKMDIEGSEKDALLGAKSHISSSYPKMAICIYHHISDLWEIPLMISSIFPAYSKFIIRHHSKNAFETVLYVYK